MDTNGDRDFYTTIAISDTSGIPGSSIHFNPEQDYRDEVLRGLQSIDKNLDLIRKALVAKKKRNATS